SHINSPIHVGKTAIFKSDVEVYHGVNLLLMRPKPFLDKTYFEHYLKYLYQNGYWKGLCKQSVNQASVNQQDINKVDIAYPKSLPEQQRIVSILDKAFSAIEQSRNNAEQNLKNAKELFESYLQGVLEKKGEGWEGKTLGEIAFVKSGGTPLRHKTEYWSGDIAWYSSGELNNLYTKNPERHINKLAIDNSNAKLFPKGSLLIGMYDTAALKMSILDREGTFNQAIAGVKPNPKIDLIFILHSINAIKPEILNLRRGVRQKNLSLEKIKNIPVAIPPLKDQQAIVSQLDALRAETQKLEAIYRQKLAGLEELKKSILQKAFNGGLTGSELAEPMRELETKKAVAV
ncbi:MAG: restriction endonuclease subunit S, partial [Cyclobacteriaceae bacterium]|nr:restriction endonuclease subunit S [Cyclobacteriaceae bacterium]